MVESQRFSGDVGRHSFLKNSFEKRVGRCKVVNDQDVLDGVKLDDLSYTLAMYQPVVTAYQLDHNSFLLL